MAVGDGVSDNGKTVGVTRGSAPEARGRNVWLSNLPGVGEEVKVGGTAVLASVGVTFCGNDWQPINDIRSNKL